MATQTAELQADNVLDDFTNRKLVELMTNSEELCHVVAALAMNADSSESIRRMRLYQTLLAHCEDALVRQYDADVEAERHAYSMGDR